MPNIGQTLPNIMGMNKLNNKGNSSITQSKQGGRQTHTADSGFRADRGIARNLSQYAGSGPGPQYYVDIGQAPIGQGRLNEGSMKSAGG